MINSDSLRVNGDYGSLMTKVLESTSQAVIVTDGRAKILHVNEAFRAITGYSREEVCGKNPLMLCPQPLQDGCFEHIKDQLLVHGKWQGEFSIATKSGTINPVWLCISEIRDPLKNITHYAGIALDISLMKQNEERLQYMANYDMLTKLPNRSLMYDRLKQTLILAKRNRTAVCVMLLDIDRFKEVNDNLGHHIGDQLLIEVAKRLLGCVRESDTIARMGGDEFLVILSDVGSEINVSPVAQKFLSALTAPLQLEGHDLFVSASIGVTLYPNDSEDMHTLVKYADTAMYHAKAQGKNNYKFFTEGINKSTIERFKLETSFRRALEKLEFQLFYQPKIDVRDGRVSGMEALLRWYHPEQGFVTPGLFIPLAEETGLVVELGEWALREACRQNKVWQDEGLPHQRVAVNLSASHFYKKDLMGMVQDILRETGLAPQYLMLEVTEGTIVQDVDETIRTFQEFRQMGIGISIDDFGTGFSSLNYLNLFSLDEIKIDQSFINDINKSDSNKVITAIIALAHNLNMQIVAEGVETEEQVAFLKKHQCDQMQGYYFCKPLNSEDFRDFLKKDLTSARLPND